MWQLQHLGDGAFGNRLTGNVALPRIGCHPCHPAETATIRDTLSQNVLQLFHKLIDFDLCPESLNLLEQSLADEPPATLQHTGVIGCFSEELNQVGGNVQPRARVDLQL